jgi:hypothetical protein
MPDETDKFWGAMVSQLRRGLRLHPLCADEAEKEYKAAKPEPLPESTLDAMLDSITSGRDDWASTRNVVNQGLESGIDEDALQLNRNAGDADAEVDDRVEELRRKALGNDGEADQDQTGMADGSEPPGKGR